MVNYSTLHTGGIKEHLVRNDQNQLHSYDGEPGLVKFWRDVVTLKEWYVNGLRHRNDDKPARIEYDNQTGKVLREMWCKDGNFHREHAPAIIEYYKNGNIDTVWWYIDNKSFDILKLEAFLKLSKEDQVTAKIAFG